MEKQEKPLMAKIYDDISPLSDPKERSVVSNLFWAFLCGWASYVAIRDAILITGWWWIVAFLTMSAVTMNTFFAVTKLRNLIKTYKNDRAQNN